MDNVSSSMASFLSGSDGYTAGSLSGPVALAITLSGNAWVANGNRIVTELVANSSTGALFSGGSLSLPSGVAIDASNNVWIANSLILWSTGRELNPRILVLQTSALATSPPVLKCRE